MERRRSVRVEKLGHYERRAADKKLHQTKVSTKISRSSVEENPYSCDQCDYKCSQAINLTKHRTIHDRIMYFSCTECDYKSSAKSSMRQHWKMLHSNGEMYTCLECSKTFSQQHSLKTHVEAIHLGLRPHACEACSRTFSVKAALQKHIKTVHLKEKPYACSDCSKRFSQLIHVRKHVDAVHKGYRPFQCPQCDLSFARKANLERHAKCVHGCLDPGVSLSSIYDDYGISPENKLPTITGEFSLKAEPQQLNVEEYAMDPSPDSENCVLQGPKTEPVVKCETEDCDDLDSKPYTAGAPLQHSTETIACPPLAEQEFEVENIKQEFLPEASLRDSEDADLSEDEEEEFADLLQRCFPKSDADIGTNSSEKSRGTVQGVLTLYTDCVNKTSEIL